LRGVSRPHSNMADIGMRRVSCLAARQAQRITHAHRARVIRRLMFFFYFSTLFLFSPFLIPFQENGSQILTTPYLPPRRVQTGSRCHHRLGRPSTCSPRSVTDGAALSAARRRGGGAAGRGRGKEAEKNDADNCSSSVVDAFRSPPRSMYLFETYCVVSAVVAQPPSSRPSVRQSVSVAL